MQPIEILSDAVESYAPYLDQSGEMGDPVFGEPTQYGTAYYAFCNAVLAARGNSERRSVYIDRAVRGLNAALDHVSDPTSPDTGTGFSRDTGTISRVNDRDFFWPPMLKAFRVLAGLEVPDIDELAKRISDVDIERSFASRPPSNWAAVWLSGEWMRLQEGLSPYSLEQIEEWLGTFFDTHVLVDQGYYQEPGNPNSYDLFLRYHLADMLIEGYAGRWQGTLERLMETGLQRSLDVQLSDGSLASAYRSTGQTWTLGAQIAYFTYAANHFRKREPRRSQQAMEAARRALSSFQRWQRVNSPYSPVENRLPPGYRVGYEGYTADGHYGTLAMGFLAVAILNGFEEPAIEPTEGRSPSLRIEYYPTYRTVAHNDSYSLHVNADPTPGYDGFGIVDLTFGPGRFLHFASSAKHLESGRLYNLGLAHRSRPGRSHLEVAALNSFAVIDVTGESDTPPRLQLRCRAKGSSYAHQATADTYYTEEAMPGLTDDTYVYQLAAGIEADAVYIEEATPGLDNYKTLLIPYLRDPGTGVITEIQSADGEVRLVHGQEEVAITCGATIDYVLHIPYGFENRRGLCGLIRVDFQDKSEGIAYRVSVVR